MKRRYPVRALPLGIRLSDFYWQPTQEEKAVDSKFLERQRRNRLDKLRRLERLWAEQDLARMRRRVAELESVVKQDRAFVAREEAFEKEIQRRKAIILKLHDEEAEAERKRLLTKLAKVTAEMNAATVRSERALLARRGVVRGARKIAP